MGKTCLILKKHSDLDTAKIYKIINNINWSYKRGDDHQFLGSVINIDGNIQTGKGIKDRLRDLIIYWILGPDKAKIFFEGNDRLEKLTEEWRRATNQDGDIPEVKNK